MALLSFNAKSLATMTDILQKKLAKVVEHATLDKPLLRRLKTLIPPPNRHNPPKRSTLILGLFSSLKLLDTSELVLLKALTVIAYLCQYGSSLFIDWIRRCYSRLVAPLGRLAYLAQYSRAIHLKVGLVVRYCEDESQLLSVRHSLDQLRSEMRPGIVGDSPKRK